MTLHQKVLSLIGQLEGTDATERATQRDKVAGELVRLVTNESAQASVSTARPTAQAHAA